MKMKKSQFREDAATYIQMIHLLNEYNPGWKIILIGVLLEGIFPFIAIFLSSMLLDALYSGRSMQEMALLVLAGTGASFVTAILRHLVTKKKNIMWWGMQHRMTEPIMTKTMQMDYEQIGDERVRTLRARQDEYRKREKDVFERFLTQLEILLTAAVRMVAAIICKTVFKDSWDTGNAVSNYSNSCIVCCVVSESSLCIRARQTPFGNPQGA